MNALEPRHSFQSIVSLGGLCQVAVQIERRFGFRFNSPFDWLVTPLTSIGRILRDDGAGFCKAVKVINHGSTAVCARYGVAYQHAFPRDENRLISIDVEALMAAREKMIYKYNRFTRLLSESGRTLFVRFGGHHDSALPLCSIKDERIVGNSDLNGLCDAIAERFPRLSFAVAFVYNEDFTTYVAGEDRLDERVRVFSLKGDDGRDWQGNDQSWKPVFDHYAFDLQARSGVALQFSPRTIDPEHLHA